MRDRYFGYHILCLSQVSMRKVNIWGHSLFVSRGGPTDGSLGGGHRITTPAIGGRSEKQHSSDRGVIESGPIPYHLWATPLVIINEHPLNCFCWTITTLYGFSIVISIDSLIIKKECKCVQTPCWTPPGTLNLNHIVINEPRLLPLIGAEVNLPKWWVVPEYYSKLNLKNNPR